MEELKNKLSLSSITLGTMRFADKNMSVEEVIRLIEEANDIGITTHHSSYEYSSYELYCNALKKTSCKNNLKHIAKISAPHFEDSEFSFNNLEERVDNELERLNVDTIDVLQWLVRSKPINDIDRLHTLNSQQKEIEEGLNTLKNKGKVKSVFSFPYSVNFAEEVIKISVVDGIVAYLNHEEKEYEPFANSKPFIAIRPFFAGKLIEKLGVEASLNYTCGQKGVLSTIVGINRLSHLESYKKFL
ncbi:hypothetical protein WH52_09005 [Tenacibaculum holothuriorum]|uniref:NADP-dependent oxidoreductase domain-containing protein n=1 Tax=Tenacibaculum holothuriorum TaxID=1635173 RepID=A0A1Y2PCH5_9FLAO|nr:aldo/keto reductase [Tenacibaculum holothuriorum]OSY88145.1 hypothetical protein WH52_09005 [Tenacibaculum holothuriorum]